MFTTNQASYKIIHISVNLFKLFVHLNHTPNDHRHGYLSVKERRNRPQNHIDYTLRVLGCGGGGGGTSLEIYARPSSPN